MQAFVNWTTGGAAEWKAPGQTAIEFDLGITLFPKHPAGRRSSIVITHGVGVTGTAKQDAAWQWVQFITNEENGVLQVLGGAGSPGARPDVWEDKRLAERDPIFALSQRTFKEPAGDEDRERPHGGRGTLPAWTCTTCPARGAWPPPGRSRPPGA